MHKRCTVKIGKMPVHVSVRPCIVNIFKTLKLQDCWAEVDEIWHVYSTGQVTKLLGILNFGPHATHECSLVGRDL